MAELELRAINRENVGRISFTLVFPRTDPAAKLFRLDRAPERARPKRVTVLRCKPREISQSIDLPNAVVKPS
jgi:hypothetical protein